MKKIVEICCGSYDDARAAFLGGAHRIELNQALFLGGLTPGIGSLILTKQHTSLEVISMVRPRGAGFCYTESEYNTMTEDCRLLLENGSDGIAFGFLTEDFTIDEERTRSFTDLIHSYGKTAVFHRAFDCTKDPFQAIELLIRLGVDRVLTSGLADKAVQGIDLLKKLQDLFGSRIEILAGSGINASNAKELMDKTGLTQVHSSCKAWAHDATTKGSFVSYAYCPQDELAYDIVSTDLVKKIVSAVEN